VASLSQGRTAAAQCGLFTHKSVPVIFEPPCTYMSCLVQHSARRTYHTQCMLLTLLRVYCAHRAFGVPVWFTLATTKSNVCLTLKIICVL